MRDHDGDNPRSQLEELAAARDQMERLVRVIVEIGSALDLDSTLHRIVNAAMELTDAPYAALGIRAPDRTQPEDIGALAVFLAGDAAATITGASYSIDGGWTAQ